MQAGLTTELFLHYIVCCIGFALLEVQVLDDPCIDIFFSVKIESEFF